MRFHRKTGQCERDMKQAAFSVAKTVQIENGAVHGALVYDVAFSIVFKKFEIMAKK